MPGCRAPRWSCSWPMVSPRHPSVTSPSGPKPMSRPSAILWRQGCLYCAVFTDPTLNSAHRAGRRPAGHQPPPTTSATLHLMPSGMLEPSAAKASRPSCIRLHHREMLETHGHVAGRDRDAQIAAVRGAAKALSGHLGRGPDEELYRPGLPGDGHRRHAARGATIVYHAICPQLIDGPRPTTATNTGFHDYAMAMVQAEALAACERGPG